MYPRRNPPVGAKSAVYPPRPPEKTGRPRSPAPRKLRTASAPSRGPNNKPVRTAAAFCSTSGTGLRGMLTSALELMSAAKSATKAKDLLRCMVQYSSEGSMRSVTRKEESFNILGGATGIVFNRLTRTAARCVRVGSFPLCAGRARVVSIDRCKDRVPSCTQFMVGSVLCTLGTERVSHASCVWCAIVWICFAPRVLGPVLGMIR